MPAIDLPPKYYLDYFQFVLRFVREHYADTLTDEEYDFLDAFAALPEDARCLYVRMANRRGLFFRAERFDYPEIDDPVGGLRALVGGNFAEPLRADHAADREALLPVFTKDDWAHVLRRLQPDLKGVRSWKRPAVMEAVRALPFADVVDVLNAGEAVVRQCRHETVELLKFCFFGTLEADMSQFVIRDVGHAKLEDLSGKRFVPHFRSRREANDKLAVSRAYQHFRHLREEADVEQLFTWLMGWSSRHRDLSEQARPLFERMVLKAAARMEKGDAPDLALNTYRLTDQPPARERRARLLHKLDRTDEALTLCAEISADPRNAEERFFATDFCDRVTKKKRRKQTTQTLKEADVVQIPADYQYQVERGVMEHFAARGYRAAHTENYLWRGFFGLALWDVIYDDEAGALHNPLQRAPSDLFKPEFLERRRARIESELTFLDRKREGKQRLRQRYAEKEGTVVPLVGWHESLLPLVLACYGKLQPKQLRAIFLEMARDLGENGCGFPDLFVWNSRSYEFIEVKSPNDHLSAQQLHWLRFFEEVGVRARVLRVEWG
ncbi:MAG: VRR-NUC domain-containing protein [Catalinimonas sp.]